MRLLLIGPPGCGKGTQGARIAERYGVQHIAPGDILRAEVAADTELGRQIAGYVAAAYWFTSSTSFANPAVTLARSLTRTFAGIRPNEGHDEGEGAAELRRLYGNDGRGLGFGTASGAIG